MIHRSEHLQVKMRGLKDVLCDSLGHIAASMRFLVAGGVVRAEGRCDDREMRGVGLGYMV